MTPIPAGERVDTLTPQRGRPKGTASTVPDLTVEVEDVMMTTTGVMSNEEARALDRELKKAEALYARLTDTEGKIKATKERNDGLIAELGRAELAAGGRSSPESERLRRDLAKVAAEAEDLERLELALRRAVSEQGERVDEARSAVDRLLAEAAAVEWWHELLPRLKAYRESEGVRVLNEAIARTWRTSVDGMPREKRLWLPSPAELQRMEGLTREGFERLHEGGYEVPHE